MKNKLVCIFLFSFFIFQMALYNCSIHIDLSNDEKNIDSKIEINESTPEVNRFCRFDKFLGDAFTKHRDSINVLDFHPSKNWLASGSNDGDLKVWNVLNGSIIFKVSTLHDLAKKEQCFSCSKVISVSFGPKGKYLAFGTWSIQSTLYIWDISKQAIIKKIRHIGNGVWGIAFSSDSRMVGTASGPFIRIWEVKTGRKIFEYKNESRLGFRSLLFSPDNKFLFLGKENGEIEYVEIKTGLSKKNFYHSKDKDITTLRLAKEKKFLISGSRDHSIKIWDLKNFVLLNYIEGHRGYYTSTLDFFPQKNLLLSTDSNNTVVFWDILTGLMFEKIKGKNSMYKKPTDSVALSEKSKFIAFSSAYQPIEIWNCSF